MGLWKRSFLEHAHRAGVFHALGDLHAAGAALGEAVAIEYFVESRAEAVEALVYIDAGLDRFLAKIGTRRNFNFLVLFDELDNRHVAGP